MPEASSTGFQLLTSKVVIQHDDAAVGQRLDYLAQSALHEFPARKLLSYRVSGHGPYEIREEDDLLDVVDTPDGVLNVLFARIYRRIIDRQIVAGWVALHGAVATVGGRRTLILGSKGAGKTTLALRLLFSGHDVEGDEMVFIRDGLAVACPRRFHIKPNTELLVPQLKEWLDALPRVLNGPTPIMAFDPTRAGLNWRVRLAKVERVVWLVKNHGGAAALDPSSSFDVVRQILENAFEAGERRRDLVAAATGLSWVGGFRLTNGDPEEAMRLLSA